MVEQLFLLLLKWRVLQDAAHFVPARHDITVGVDHELVARYKLFHYFVESFRVVLLRYAAPRLLESCLSEQVQFTCNIDEAEAESAHKMHVALF